MLTALLKLIFVAATIAASTYSMSVFGPGMWSWIFLGVALIVLASLFFVRLAPLAAVLGKTSGFLAATALGLLLIAAMVGGSFHLSESNVIFAYLLGLLAAAGFAAYLWSEPKGEPGASKAAHPEQSS
jgi:hypothetical protein